MPNLRHNLTDLVQLPVGHPERRAAALDPMGGVVFMVDDDNHTLRVEGRHFIHWCVNTDQGLQRRWRWRGEIADGLHIAIHHPRVVRINTPDPGQRWVELDHNIERFAPMRRDRLDLAFDGPTQTHQHWDDLIYPDSGGRAIRMSWSLPERPRLYTHPFVVSGRHATRVPTDADEPWLWSTTADLRTAWRARRMRFRGVLMRADPNLVSIASEAIGATTGRGESSHFLAAWIADHFTTIDGTWPTERTPETLLDDGMGNAEDRAILMASMLCAANIDSDVVFVDAAGRTDWADASGIPWASFCYPSAFDSVGLYLIDQHDIIDPDERDGQPRRWHGRKAIRIRQNGALEPLIIP